MFENSLEILISVLTLLESRAGGAPWALPMKTNGLINILKINMEIGSVLVMSISVPCLLNNFSFYAKFIHFQKVF